MPSERVGGRLGVHHALWVAAILVACAAALVVVPALRSPPHIPTLTIENGQVYQVAVTASDGTATTAPIGTVKRESTSAFEGVLDMGELWIFAFSYAGVDAGTLRMSRAELRAAGWRVVVPAAVGQRLRDAGLGPSAG